MQTGDDRDRYFSEEVTPLPVPPKEPSFEEALRRRAAQSGLSVEAAFGVVRGLAVSGGHLDGKGQDALAIVLTSHVDLERKLADRGVER